MNRGTHARGAAGSQRQRKGRREEKKKQQRGTTSHQRGKAVGQNRVGNCVLDRGKVVLSANQPHSHFEPWLDANGTDGTEKGGNPARPIGASKENELRGAQR
eukprot:GGOE01029848.1.p3 GENE.GGOE01029848.1~~GGOE01029848.1.p3  ORF type:complete len:102 (+),score=3.49 GGOE01029848.1:297-602(+)